jgi:hypothetical protein
MAWGTYMLRKSFGSVFIRLRVKARAPYKPLELGSLFFKHKNPFFEKAMPCLPKLSIDQSAGPAGFPVFLL